MTPNAQVLSYSLRVVVLAPTGRDEEVLVQTLRAKGMVADACSDMTELCRRIDAGAGAAVVASEALTESSRRELEETLSRQPEWSDFPIIIMATDYGELGPGRTFAREARVSYAVILERPVYSETLVSAARSALRSRTRQYQVRDELAERRRAEEALRTLDRRKDEFLAMLGHELRNPLAAIRNATELIKLLRTEAPRLERAQGVLDRQSSHMARLIDGLLEVSRISRGKIQLHRQILDLRDVIEGALGDRASEVEARSLELKKELPGEPVGAFGDDVRLTQVVDNLVANALKFTSSPGTVSVCLRKEGGTATISVRDTGVGIRPEMLPSIFEPFQQESQDSARASGGLGLGLAVAKKLVELHGGTIEAHSKGPGTGAEFLVRLPLASSSPTLDETSRGGHVPPQRILLVEDHADAAQALRALLEVEGHDVTAASTGAEALETLRERPTDVVLCDIGLGDISGYDVARAVRNDASLRKIPLVAVTGYGQPEDRQRTSDAGFNEHLTKPVDLEALQATLSKLVGSRRCSLG